VILCKKAKAAHTFINNKEEEISEKSYDGVNNPVTTTTFVGRGKCMKNNEW
jgi:hypothetical protein